MSKPVSKREPLRSMSPDSWFKLCTYENMPDMEQEPLKLINRESLYPPPLYLDPNFEHLSLEARVQLLSDYHTSLYHKIYKTTRRSLHMAPLSKEIKPQGAPIPEKQKTETCQTRSGRNIKRQKYVDKSESDEDIDDFDDFDEEIKLSGNTVNKRTPKPPVADKIDKTDVDFSPTSKFYTKVKKGGLRASTEKKVAPIFKRQDRKFSRAEMLFENLKMEENVRKEKDAAMANFERSLSQNSDDLVDNYDIVSKDTVTAEEPLEVVDNYNFEEGRTAKRSRSPSPSLLRAIRSKDSKEQNDDLQLLQDLQNALEDNDPPTKRRPQKTILSRKRRNPSKDGSVEIAPKQSKNDDVECPICMKQFPKNRIEDHASKCGESMVRVDYQPQLFCDLCEQVFLSRKELMQHSESCIASKIDK